MQSLYLEGKRDEAYAAIPRSSSTATSLIGSEAEVGERLAKIAAAGVDRLIVSVAHFDPAERNTPSNASPRLAAPLTLRLTAPTRAYVAPPHRASRARSGLVRGGLRGVRH